MTWTLYYPMFLNISKSYTKYYLNAVTSVLHKQLRYLISGIGVISVYVFHKKCKSTQNGCSVAEVWRSVSWDSRRSASARRRVYALQVCGYQIIGVLCEFADDNVLAITVKCDILSKVSYSIYSNLVRRLLTFEADILTQFATTV